MKLRRRNRTDFFLPWYWMEAFSFTPQPIYLRRKNTRCQLNGRLGGRHSRSGPFASSGNRTPAHDLFALFWLCTVKYFCCLVFSGNLSKTEMSWPCVTLRKQGFLCHVMLCYMLCYDMLCYVVMLCVMLYVMLFYVICYAILCYVMSWYVMLCYMLCYFMLYVMLCYFMLYYVMVCYVMSCYGMFCFVMLYVMLCYITLCYVILCFVMSCHVMSCYVTLQRIEKVFYNVTRKVTNLTYGLSPC